MNNKKRALVGFLTLFMAGGCHSPSNKKLKELGPPVVVAPGCSLDEFKQPKSSNRSQALDILFVINSSLSMAVERYFVAAEIDSFVRSLSRDIDYRIAVLLGHGSTSPYSGKLWKRALLPTVLDSKKMSLTEIRFQLILKMTQVAVDLDTDGGDATFYSLMRAMDPDQLKESQKSGFFRDDAALAIVFVSNQNELCAEIPDEGKLIPPFNGREKKARARDCKGVTPDTVLAKVKKRQGERDFLFGAIAFTDPSTVIPIFENRYGYGYMDLVKLSDGVSVDMARGHYAEGLAAIGELAARKTDVLTDFTLSRQDLDPATLQAWVDGSVAEFTYHEESHQIHIPRSGRPGSKIDVYYCQKTAPAPLPVPGCLGSVPNFENYPLVGQVDPNSSAPNRTVYERSFVSEEKRELIAYYFPDKIGCGKQDSYAPQPWCRDYWNPGSWTSTSSEPNFIKRIVVWWMMQTESKTRYDVDREEFFLTDKTGKIYDLFGIYELLKDLDVSFVDQNNGVTASQEPLYAADKIKRLVSTFSCIEPSPRPSPDPLPSVEPSPSPIPLPSPLVTPSPSASPSPLVSSSPEPNPSPSVTPSPSPSGIPAPLPSVSPSPSLTPCVGPACGGGAVGV